jgi:hypothetical protein
MPDGGFSNSVSSVIILSFDDIYKVIIAFMYSESFVTAATENGTWSIRRLLNQVRRKVGV